MNQKLNAQVIQLCKQARVSRGLSQEALAKLVREMSGERWDRFKVAMLERDGRRVTAVDLILIAHALDCPVSNLLPTISLPKTVPQVVDDAEWRAAARLGLKPAKVRQLAQKLWGTSLTDERDRRTNDLRPGKRAHVTRALLAEIREAAK